MDDKISNTVPVEQIDPEVNLDYITQQTDQGENNNRLPVILIVIGGAVFFLLLLVIILGALMGSSSRKTTVNKKLSPTVRKATKKITPSPASEVDFTQDQEEKLILEEPSPTAVKTRVVQELIVGLDGKIITPTITVVNQPTVPIEKQMKLTSSAFADGEKIPLKYTCSGDDVNPPLSFANIPAQTKSLVIIVDDPDAASGRFAHWLVWNINPINQELAEGFLPQGAMEGVNDFEKSGYKGPCPPEKETHTYRFILYALDSEIILDSQARLSDLEAMIKNKIIAQAQLTGKYGRE
jgi:hypothetical protein